MNNKPNTRTFIKNLVAGDRFVMDSTETVYVADKVRTMGNMTRVDYHVRGDGPGGYYSTAKVNLTTVSVFK